jgi:hypothetical protein
LRLGKSAVFVKHWRGFVNAKKVLALGGEDDIVCGPYFKQDYLWREFVN